ncbi:MAG: iron-containing alcohol dehydrogenase family protein [Armatimonadota bacterium]
MAEALDTGGAVPTKVWCGAGSLPAVWDELAALGCSRPLIVCGQTVRLAGPVEALLEVGPDVEVACYDQVEPDPSEQTIREAGALARQEGVDAVIGLGGGSSMDAAKAIAVEALEEGWIARQEAAGQPTQLDRALPIIAVPTTAGTASEVTPFSVITFPAVKRKLVLNHPDLYPKVAVLDPTLLATAPKVARMAAGLDALTHAVESYVSKQATEQTREHALQAIRLIAQHLRAAVADGEDVPAQDGMQRAATIAGLAFSHSRLGVVHALALPLSAHFGVPHGVANAILLPHGMDYNVPAAPDDFRLMGGILAGRQERAEAPEAAPEAVRSLAAHCGAPPRMRDAGVEQEAIPRMAEDAMQSAHIPVNPREVTLEDAVGLYHQAF